MKLVKLLKVNVAIGKSFTGVLLGKLMETIRIIYNLMMARKDQHLVIFL